MLWRQCTKLPEDWSRRKEALGRNDSQSDLAIRIAANNDGETTVFWDEDSNALATWTPKRRVILSRMTPRQAAGLGELLKAQNLCGVGGHSPEVEHFAQTWLNASPGRTKTPGKSLILHDLATLHRPRACAGLAQQCSRADAELVYTWAVAFRDEADNAAPPPTQPQVDLGLARGTYWFWSVEGEPVSYAGLEWVAANSSRIGPVYTPPKQRGSGYASALVHHLAELGTRGARCSLFTDQDNPTSNKIYRALGFRPGPLFQEWNFDSTDS